jgi:DNA polymerase
MSDRRNAVFLEEMGVGPQWRLRNRPAPADAYAYADVDTSVPAGDAPSPEAVPGSAPQQAAMPQSAAQQPVARQAAHPGAQPAADAQRMAYAQAAHDPAHYEPAAPSHASAPATPQSPAAAARAASAAPRGPADARQVPPPAATAPGRAGDVRQAPSAAPDAPAAPTRVPGTPSIASTGEDMSWFDDAPTPEYKPQRKKVAAPEQPVSAPPHRPAPAVQAMQPARPAMPPRTPSAPAPAMADDVPAFDDIPMDEPPSWIDDEQQAASTARRDAPAPRGAEPASHDPGPRPGRATDEEIAQMDWPALQAAVSNCTRCARCETRQQAVPGRGDEKATWIALDTAPGRAEDAEGYQFAGDPGYLLDNMLKAVGQSTEKGAYLTSLVKCHAPTAPSAEELQACRPYLQRELELTQAKVIVAFGHTTGKGLLGGAARGRIMLHGDIPVVATYHPADLLKKPEEKAKAWQDLCLAKASHAGRR